MCFYTPVGQSLSWSHGDSAKQTDEAVISHFQILSSTQFCASFSLQQRRLWQSNYVWHSSVLSNFSCTKCVHVANWFFVWKSVTTATSGHCDKAINFSLRERNLGCEIFLLTDDWYSSFVWNTGPLLLCFSRRIVFWHSISLVKGSFIGWNFPFHVCEQKQSEDLWLLVTNWHAISGILTFLDASTAPLKGSLEQCHFYDALHCNLESENDLAKRLCAQLTNGFHNRATKCQE